MNIIYFDDALYFAETITSLNRNKCLNFLRSPLSIIKLSLTSLRLNLSHDCFSSNEEKKTIGLM